jgi:hypothetical protein
MEAFAIFHNIKEFRKVLFERIIVDAFGLTKLLKILFLTLKRLSFENHFLHQRLNELAQFV